MLRQLNDFKPKIRISKNLQSEILVHHSEYKKEWCGILLFKEISGSLIDKNLEILADKMFLLQLGSEAYVGGENEDMYVDAMESIPDFMNYKCGFLHSHHSMKTFFSQTDSQELEDQCYNHEYFLSLIVNFEGEYTAKISFEGEAQSEDFKYKTRFGNYIIPLTQKLAFSLDCDVILESVDYIKNRIQTLKQRNISFSTGSYNSYNNLNDNYRGYENDSVNAYNKYKNYGNTGGYNSLNNHLTQGKQKELFPVKSSRYILNEILSHSDINLAKFVLDDNIGKTLENYEKLDEVMLNEIQINIWNSLDEIISECNHYDIGDSDKMSIVYADLANYLIDNYVSKVNKINGFTEALVLILIEALENTTEDEKEFEKVLNDHNLLQYVKTVDYAFGPTYSG